MSARYIRKNQTRSTRKCKKRDARCVHCRAEINQSTNDHVFPKSWYPETTPPVVQRWTVPSCRSCNGQYGQLEKELFVRAALCVPPEKAEAAGLSRRALESFGVNVLGITPKERRHREALRERIRQEAKPFDEGSRENLLPGFGPHPDFPAHEQYELRISEKTIKEVAGKIIRGCEFMLGNSRIVEETDELKIYFAHPERIPEVVRLTEQIEVIHLGPGFRIRRAVPHDRPECSFYKVDIWDTWTIYAVIEPRDGGEN